MWNLWARDSGGIKGTRGGVQMGTGRWKLAG
jgi:hypothetical protein